MFIKVQRLTILSHTNEQLLHFHRQYYPSFVVKHYIGDVESVLENFSHNKILILPAKE